MYSPVSVLDTEYYYLITNVVKKKKLNVILNHKLVPISNFNIIKFNHPNQIKNITDLRSCDICKLNFPLNIKAEFNLHYTTNNYSYIPTILNENEKCDDTFDICKECYEKSDKSTLPKVFSVNSYFGIGYLTDWVIIFSYVKDKKPNLSSNEHMCYSSGHIICNLNPNSEHYKKFAIMHNSYRIWTNFKCYMLDETSIEEIITKYFQCGTLEYKNKSIENFKKYGSWLGFDLNKETIKNLTPFQVMFFLHVPQCV
jgi:hypothetical protein